MAFEYYKQQKVDIVSLEVGMGGRLDATNIIDPLVSIIVSIGLDHAENLGPTVFDIASIISIIVMNQNRRKGWDHQGWTTCCDRTLHSPRNLYRKSKTNEFSFENCRTRCFHSQRF
jgi:hypothetical protein